MPELPEIQAHAERLTQSFGGSVIARFTALSFTALKTYSPAPGDAVGRELTEVGRRGKYLLLHVDGFTFVVHLMQGGRLRPDEKQAAKPRDGLARWSFSDGRNLLLSEAGKEKRAGVWMVAGEPGDHEPLEGLGPDADAVSTADLGSLLSASSMRLHGFLRDQRLIAGIGRRLASEICHTAGISPFANTAKLDPDEVVALHAAIRGCIDESLSHERTRDDMSSSKERPGRVYHRTGEACLVCGDTVRSVEYVRYTVDYCPTCQTGGKILADNTTSKFLK